MVHLLQIEELSSIKRHRQEKPSLHPEGFAFFIIQLLLSVNTQIGAFDWVGFFHNSLHQYSLERFDENSSATCGEKNLTHVSDLLRAQ